MTIIKTVTGIIRRHKLDLLHLHPIQGCIDLYTALEAKIRERKNEMADLGLTKRDSMDMRRFARVRGMAASRADSPGVRRQEPT